MSVGMSSATAGGVLSAVFQGVSFSVTSLWAQLHVGNPGSDGTANPAGETTRVDASACFGTAPDDDGSGTKWAIINDTAIGPWLDVSTTQDYSHVSFWDASSGGTFVGSGALVSPRSVTAGDDFTILSGDCTATLPIAA